MNAEKSIFSQITQWVPHYEFQRLVAHYKGNYKVRAFSCWDQFLCMMFAQLTYRQSLRDIEACLRARPALLYHMGIRGQVSRSTLAEANEQRDWRIYGDLAQKFIRRARHLYAQDAIGVELEATVYALDSTTVDLCLTLFPWARFRRHKAAIKLHTLLDLRGAIPTLIYLSDGRVHDVNVLDELLLEAGAYYIMDRGYVDFARLYRFTMAAAYWVTRAKHNLCCRVVESRPVPANTGVRSDQLVYLTGPKSAKGYPERLRRIRYYDEDTQKTLVFLTNNLWLPATTIALLYKRRWQIELFFKWIKQNLRIKTFYGYSDNAVRTQVWIAICSYVLVAIIRKELRLDQSMAEILQIVSVSAFDKLPLAELLAKNEADDAMQNNEGDSFNQLVFNDL